MLVAMGFGSQLLSSTLSSSSKIYPHPLAKRPRLSPIAHQRRAIYSTSTNSMSFLGLYDNLAVGSGRKISSIQCLSALTPELKTTLDKVVTSQKVVLFMKGTKEFPQCGFSNTVVQILKSLNVPFETINILENETIRQGLKHYSNWPTFPQLYIGGEFFGGCDITVVQYLLGRELKSKKFREIVADAYKSGELQELLEKAMCS